MMPIEVLGIVSIHAPRRHTYRLTMACTKIFGFLRPLDLLNMARTAKIFARLLLDPESRNIWREARQEIAGFPDCQSPVP